MRFRLLVDGSESEAGMRDDGRDERGSKLAAWEAWVAEIVRSGRVVDITGDDDTGAIIISPCHDSRSTGRSPVPEDDPVANPTPTRTEGDTAGSVIVDRT